jgi:hypothetical protein
VEGFEPQWQGVFENWMRSYLRDHYWKVEQELTLNEAVQEGAEIFAWCLRKTTSRGGRIDNNKWFMRYFQRAVGTWLIDTAAKATARRETLLTLTQQQPIATVEPDGPLFAALSQDTSHELRTVLRFIIETPSEYFLGLLLRPGPDNIWSRRMCRLCGIPVNENIISELRKLLSLEYRGRS